MAAFPMLVFLFSGKRIFYFAGKSWKCWILHSSIPFFQELRLFLKLGNIIFPEKGEIQWNISTCFTFVGKIKICQVTFSGKKKRRGKTYKQALGLSIGESQSLQSSHKNITFYLLKFIVIVQSLITQLRL